MLWSVGFLMSFFRSFTQNPLSMNINLRVSTTDFYNLHVQMQKFPPSLWAGRVTGSIQTKEETDVPMWEILPKHATCSAYLLLIDLPNINSNYTNYAKLNVHCKDNIPKIRNKYSQKWNCAFSVPIPTVHLCFCERFIYSHCADQPYILSWPMVISSSVNGLLVAM